MSGAARGARRTGALATMSGLLLIAGHAVLLPVLLEATTRSQLTVLRSGSLVDDRPSLTGWLPLDVEVSVEHDGDGPGLVWTRWTRHHRGGVTRAVGAYQLVGPFQDVDHPPCTGRLAVGQRLLDDGAAGPGTVAAVVAAELDAALRGTSHFGIGSYRRVDDLHVTWAELGDHPLELPLLGPALRAPRPRGYLRAQADLVFDRVRAPVVLIAVPRLDDGQLGFTVDVAVGLQFGNRALDWLSDRIGGDAFATRTARGLIDASLLAALGPPPPVPLPGGGQLIVEPCPDRPVEVRSGQWAAVPLRWRLGGPVPVPATAGGGPPVRPPARGPAVLPEPAAGTAVTIDLDLDGLNGLLYELWRAGWLDRTLDAIAVHDRFNHDDTVRSLLTVRLSPLRLALPPTLAPAAAGRLRLALAVAVTIADGQARTPAQAWGALDVALGSAPAPGGAGDRITATVGVSALELACEPEPSWLRPCYGDIVAAVRAGSGDTHAAMGQALAEALTSLFVDQRLADQRAPAALVLDGVRAATTTSADNAAVRVELDARIVPAN